MNTLLQDDTSYLPVQFNIKAQIHVPIPLSQCAQQIG